MLSIGITSAEDVSSLNINDTVSTDLMHDTSSELIASVQGEEPSLDVVSKDNGSAVQPQNENTLDAKSSSIDKKLIMKMEKHQ